MEEVMPQEAGGCGNSVTINWIFVVREIRLNFIHIKLIEIKEHHNSYDIILIPV